MYFKFFSTKRLIISFNRYDAGKRPDIMLRHKSYRSHIVRPSVRMTTNYKTNFRRHGCRSQAEKILKVTRIPFRRRPISCNFFPRSIFVKYDNIIIVTIIKRIAIQALYRCTSYKVLFGSPI